MQKIGSLKFEHFVCMCKGLWRYASYVNHFVNVTVDVGQRQKCWRL